jgi:hypothetical protein
MMPNPMKHAAQIPRPSPSGAPPAAIAWLAVIISVVNIADMALMTISSFCFIFSSCLIITRASSVPDYGKIISDVLTCLN